MIKCNVNVNIYKIIYLNTKLVNDKLIQSIINGITIKYYKTTFLKFIFNCRSCSIYSANTDLLQL